MGLGNLCQIVSVPVWLFLLFLQWICDYDTAFPTSVFMDYCVTVLELRMTFCSSFSTLLQSLCHIFLVTIMIFNTGCCIIFTSHTSDSEE